MTDRPIIFSAPMVQAILDGRKTQTRRVLKPQPGGVWSGFGYPRAIDDTPAKHRTGDRLWVREALDMGHAAGTPICHATYRADGADCDLTPYGAAEWAERQSRNTITSIFMPRWASRLTLVVTDVRVQSVQDISEADAAAEGIYAADLDPPHAPWTWARGEWHYETRREAFQALWDTINAKRGYGWGTNPWVVAVTFETHRCNIDRMESDA